MGITLGRFALLTARRWATFIIVGTGYELFRRVSRKCEAKLANRKFNKKSLKKISKQK